MFENQPTSEAQISECSRTILHRPKTVIAVKLKLFWQRTFGMLVDLWMNILRTTWGTQDSSSNKLVFYAQSTGAVISGRTQDRKYVNLVFYAQSTSTVISG